MLRHVRAVRLHTRVPRARAPQVWSQVAGRGVSRLVSTAAAAEPESARKSAASECPVATPGMGSDAGVAPAKVTFQDVAEAHYRIRNDIRRTSCKRSQHLSKMLGVDVFLKREYQHESGSFKERGACNALHMLGPEERRRGVIAASAGNHALALARHGQRMGIPVTVVMPTVAPITKVSNCREYGARVLVQGDHIVESKAIAEELMGNNGLTYINGYDDPAIIAGAGTVAFEALEQVQNVDAVVVPVGGAGLLAGVGRVVKTLRPDAEVIGVEPRTCASFTAALNAGRVVDSSVHATLADGLAVPRVGANAFETAKDVVDRVVQVDERSIALAVLRLVEMEKCVVEGGGAVGLAAILQGELDDLKGKNVVLPLCGGNIDTTVLGRVIDRGLVADGRVLRFVSTISDRPGGVAGLTSLIASNSASIKEIVHERAWMQSNVHEVQVKCVVEVPNRAAGEELYTALLDAGYPTIMMKEDIISPI